MDGGVASKLTSPTGAGHERRHAPSADFSGIAPARGRQLQSTVTAAGEIHLELAEVVVKPPQLGEVVVQIEAAPINPSDLMAMLGPVTPAEVQFGHAARPRARVPLSRQDHHTLRARIGTVLPIGQEGAGIVVAAAEDQEQLVGRRVAVMPPAGGAFADYLTVAAVHCVAVPTSISPSQAAAAMVNPLTALAIAETVRLDGHRGIIHTAAASCLGQMLVKVCADDDIPLVNVVRRDDQALMLRAMGAEHVCDSSQPSFTEDLNAAVASTGATAAFDAIGGGTMAGDLLRAMECAATARTTRSSPYGSLEFKHVYLYGHLDPRPTLLHSTGNGLSWGLSSWMMPHTLARVGGQRTAELRQRIMDELGTTFATSFAHTIRLTEMLSPSVMRAYSRHATGAKYLVRPTFDPAVHGGLHD